MESLCTTAPSKTAKAEGDYHRFTRNVRAYGKYRRILLLALRAFLDHKHETDKIDHTWAVLQRFAEKLRKGDVVVTLNYDSSVERVLHSLGKWSPSDGCGFEIVCQRSEHDATRVTFEPSLVKVLHLHGAVGWSRRPTFRAGFDPTRGPGGAVDPSDLAPGPRDTEVALSPAFFRGLKIPAVDAALPTRPINENTIYLHPSFMKDYEQEAAPNDALIKLWIMAAEVLRSAREVFVIGYSLPKADSAAMTLLLTNSNRNAVRIVNQNTTANHRLRRLLSGQRIGPCTRFEDWVQAL